MSNGLVDVVIGLVLMYLLLSLIGTIANEYITTIMDLRAKTLKAGIEKLIDNEDLKRVFLGHGLVDSAKKSAEKPNGASYLSGRSFALALLDSLGGDPQTTAGAAKPNAPADLGTLIEGLPRSNIKDVLVTAVAEAKGDIDKLRTGVAAWFDDSMDRMSGIYKRKLQLISFLVGLAIAVALNADTLTVANALWTDTSLQAKIEKSAEETIKAGQEAAAKQNIDTLLKTLRPLPIGWFGVSLWPEPDTIGNFMWALLKIVGWLLTALAISLGAPFWFDTLNKFMNIRATGAKPAPEAVKS
jgi:hypothetical protein